MQLASKDDPVLSEYRPAYAGSPSDLRATAFEMFQTMQNHKGIGLAAPQVGLRIRMFVMSLKGGPFREAYVCINPEIVSSSEAKAEDREGCLSFPGYFVPVQRPASVEVKYTDLRGKRHHTSMYGLLARCFQHELDHLNGVTIHQEQKTEAIGMDHLRIAASAN